MSAPLVINLRDGSVWERRAVTREGVALYAVGGSCSCPEFLMATLSELAGHGIVGSADVLPVPVGPKPQTLSVELEQEIRSLDLLSMMSDRAASVVSGHLAVLLAEIDRLRAERHVTNEALTDITVALREREATPLTVFRASHDSIVMGLYTTAAAAREHCEAEERRAWAKSDAPTHFDWIEDEEDGVAELTAWVGGEECTTDYVVTALEVSAAYDPDGEE
jgi:hypothetical protein